YAALTLGRLTHVIKPDRKQGGGHPLSMYAVLAVYAAFLNRSVHWVDTLWVQDALCLQPLGPLWGYLLSPLDRGRAPASGLQSHDRMALPRLPCRGSPLGYLLSRPRPRTSAARGQTRRR